MSCPQSTFNTVAASRAVLVRGPIWSNDEAIAIRPWRDTRPYVGFNPTIPHMAAGCRTEPPVSDPRANTARLAATAAADPPDDPPGIILSSNGFLVGPKAELSVVLPIAASSMLVLPRNVAPACRSFLITVAS